MKRRSVTATGWGVGLALAVATVLVTGTVSRVGAKDDGTAPAKKKLTGEQLYAINCNRCHNERYPTEFTKVQWKTLLMHMRVRANLPLEQAQAVYKYMQENK